MKTLSTIAVLLFLLLSSHPIESGRAALASYQPEPPVPYEILPHLSEPGGPDAFVDKDGFLHTPGRAELLSTTIGPLSSQSIHSAGGPDRFGYVWTDTEPLNWIDATAGGTDTGLNATGCCQRTASIQLPFDFSFYENTFNAIQIASTGFLGFGTVVPGAFFGNTPSPVLPNNLLAPYGASLSLSQVGPTGRVYYKGGGLAPNRYFVVEWHEVRDAAGAGPFTFEAVLHESGDIVFQYLQMNAPGSRTCSVTGIENKDGTDGLAVGSYCAAPRSNYAIRFSRPQATARVYPQELVIGNLGAAGTPSSAPIAVNNFGNLGADVFDITLSSTWPAHLERSDTRQPVADTDSDGLPDTGSLSAGSTITLTLVITAPPGTPVGGSTVSTVNFRSSLNTSKSQSVQVRTSIPPRFALSYWDTPDIRTSRLLLAKSQASADFLDAPVPTFGAPLGIVEKRNGGFFTAWSETYCATGSSCLFANRKLSVTSLNEFGESTGTNTDISKHSQNTQIIQDFYANMAVASDGRVGIVWHRQRINAQDTNRTSDNIVFAILDDSGALTFGPQELTSNPEAPSGPTGTMRAYRPQITATDDNRFAITWSGNVVQSTGNGCNFYCLYEDAFLAILDTSGAAIRSATRVTNDTPGFQDGFRSPRVAAVSGNRIVLAYERFGLRDIQIQAFDSTGAVLGAAVNVSTDGTATGDYEPVIRRLASDRLMVAWLNSGHPSTPVKYALLNANLSTVTPSTSLSPIANMGSAAMPDISDDGQGRAIVTWTQLDGTYLVYSLISDTDNILTPPQVLIASKPSAQATLRRIVVSGNYGNRITTYSAPISEAADSSATSTAALAAASPGGIAVIPIRLNNYGLQSTGSGTLSVTLESGLTYLGDTSGISPTIPATAQSQHYSAVAQTQAITWQIPQLRFLTPFTFDIRVGVAVSETIGARKTVQVASAFSGDAGSLTNNTDTLEVFVARQVFLPLARR